jgi:hypothetical protein
MRCIPIILCLLLLMITGCDPVDAVRRMREANRQKQKENNELQLKKALENFKAGSEKSDVPRSDPSKP